MIKTKILYLILAGLFFVLPFQVNAQEESDLSMVSATISNRTGYVLKEVHIQAFNSKNRAVTNEDGSFSIRVENEDILIISHLGYEKAVVYVKEGNLESDTIVLKQWGTIEPQEDTNIALGSLPFERITGSVERITGEELNDFPTPFVREALAGRLSGLTTSYGDASTVTESFGNGIRGQEVGQLYVDGVPAVDIVLTPAEVDDVIVAKDYGSTFMFGTLGAPGALIVNTKRGLPGERLFRITSNTGVRTPAFLPSTMNAQDYARNYNIALSNDGFSPIYTQNDINDYATGNNPVRNPNNNYYEDFVNGISTYSHVTGDFSGGNEKVQYFSHLGYYTTNGIETVGEGRKSSRIRLNNNVQIQFGDAGVVNLGVGGSFNKRNEPKLSANDAFNTMYNYPANALPYKVNDTIFTSSREFSRNLLVDLAHSSIIEDIRRDAFARVGLDLNLDKVTKGLTLKTLVGMYVLNVLTDVIEPTPHTAEPIFTLENDGTYRVSGLRNFINGEDRFQFKKLADRVDRTQFINANLSYVRNFNDNHKVIADLFFNNQKLTGSTLAQNVIFRNIGARVNYMFNQKYVLEGKLLNAPIRQLSKDEKKKVNYDAGLAWLLHKESFLKNASWLNFLKLRGNFGVQSRPVSQFFISENLYKRTNAGGNFGVDGGQTGSTGTNRIFTASNLITPKQEYLSIGLDFQMFKSKINGQLNYFNIRNYDQIISPGNLFAFLPTAYLPLINYEDSRFRGIDGNISYSNKIGNLSYKIGVNATYGVNYTTLSNDTTYPIGEEQRNVIGNNEVIRGLKAIGIFQNEAEIASAPTQLFGDVKPGDIRYLDFNNDGLIDEKDYHEIGTPSRVDFGLNYMMQYKNWSMGIHADGKVGGSYIEQLNWNRKANDYTNELANSWPVSNSLPRLTTLTNTNNYRNSSFWLKKAGYLNLRSIMVAYSLPQALLKDLGVKEFSLSASTKNPFVISYSDQRFMPSRNKGYSQHPVLRTFELGVQVSF
ncbi:SusC/RagA family TonB-linked outer membrane protein [Flavivirga eckloniae]|nr:SusC/RagA family TonB-linked outer membrane protein [Flavivirga eckloniae]